MKIAPLIAAFKASGQVEPFLVHTGQHYDKRMSQLFFEELEIPEPDLNLEVGSGSHAQQTAQIMMRFEPVVLEQKPDWVVVVGDVNSTIACALVAQKLGVKVAHVEAGLRSFDRSMPEEVNRILTDSISDLLFVTEQSGIDNLKHEGVDDAKVHLVGNVMIDTLVKNRTKADASTVLEDLGLTHGGYGVATLHRPSNVDDPAVLGQILDALEVVSAELPVVMPLHPRTRASLARMGLAERVEGMKGLKTPEPFGYLDFLKLMSSAAVVLTDSGGIQEETTILQVQCITIRENTERPITLTHGTNRLVSPTTAAILAAYGEARSAPKDGSAPPLWDGSAAARIAKVFVAG